LPKQAAASGTRTLPVTPWVASEEAARREMTTPRAWGEATDRLLTRRREGGRGPGPGRRESRGSRCAWFPKKPGARRSPRPGGATSQLCPCLRPHPKARRRGTRSSRPVIAGSHGAENTSEEVPARP
jgi:hypothetical protein